MKFFTKYSKVHTTRILLGRRKSSVAKLKEILSKIFTSKNFFQEILFKKFTSRNSLQEIHFKKFTSTNSLQQIPTKKFTSRNSLQEIRFKEDTKFYTDWKSFQRIRERMISLKGKISPTVFLIFKTYLLNRMVSCGEKKFRGGRKTFVW